MQNAILNIYDTAYLIKENPNINVLENSLLLGNLDCKIKIFIKESALNNANENVKYILKIFDSVALKQNDLCFIHFKEETSFLEIIKTIPLKDVFIFGYTHSFFNLKCTKLDYSIIKLFDSHLIFCENIETLKLNKDSKLKLWNLLKSLYT